LARTVAGTALVVRELGMPAVPATTDATSRIVDGSMSTVDAEQALVLVQ
jgi:phosphohistidine swiveling domain-containing protein